MGMFYFEQFGTRGQVHMKWIQRGHRYKQISCLKEGVEIFLSKPFTFVQMINSEIILKNEHMKGYT